MKITTKQLVQTAFLLAICIVSQFFKNLSVYITGPIVNAVLILAVLTVGLWSGILISLVTPITAFFLTGSPIMAAIPLMFPVIMLGNMILVFCTWYFVNKKTMKAKLIWGVISGSVLKAAFLGIAVALVLLPLFGGSIAAYLPKPEALPKVLQAARITFSLTQLITALIGSLLACIIYTPLKKFLERNQ